MGPFQAAVYQGPSGDKIVAYQGSVDKFDWLVDDVAIFAGAIPPQVAPAIMYASAHAGPRTYLTGHSLGGALAVIASARCNLPAITFNAPGVMDSCVATAYAENQLGLSGLDQFLQMVLRCLGAARVKNFRILADPVSSFFTTGAQPGSTTTYASECSVYNVKCTHGMGTCLSEVRAKATNYQPVIL